MTQFTSKLQHNTYEIGEFSEEQTRTLEETLTLIKTFPWDAERHLTDIQLTGPSVTIINENGDYLKVSLYFNGKFCLYFLDHSGHIYEYHAPDMETACGLVTDYFNGTLNLQKFDKHLIDVGARKHFKSKNFDYTVNHTSFYVSLFVFMALMLFMVVVLIPVIIKDGAVIISIAFAVATIVIVAAAINWFKTYLKSKNMFLHLSKGNNIFRLGEKDAINTYNKADIKAITISNVAKNQKLAIYNITFNNDTSIRFSGLLIPHYDFINKFPGIDFEYTGNKWPVSL